MDINIQKKLRVYIAASYPRYNEAHELGIKLEEMGFEVISYWHQGEEKIANYKSAQRAMGDLFAIQQCDLFIELIGDEESKGGRHCELGMALAWNMKIILIGDEDYCIFTHLPWLPRMKNVKEFLKKII